MISVWIKNIEKKYLQLKWWVEGVLFYEITLKWHPLNIKEKKIKPLEWRPVVCFSTTTDTPDDVGINHRNCWNSHFNSYTPHKQRVGWLLKFNWS